jgi:tetratricopeptide (TPR) repeat protein
MKKILFCFAAVFIAGFFLNTASARALTAEEHINRAKELINSGDYAQTIAYVNKALREYPRNAALHTALGLAHEALGQENMAIPSLQEAVNLKGGYGPAYALGLIYWNRGDHHNAIRYLNNAASFWSPKIAGTDVFNTLAYSYLAVDNAKEAKDSLMRAYEYNPDHPVTLYLLGVSNDALKKRSQAREFYGKYLKSGHQNPQMRDIAGRRLEKLDRR